MDLPLVLLLFLIGALLLLVVELAGQLRRPLQCLLLEVRQAVIRQAKPLLLVIRRPVLLV
jgi:hypothetical protein